MHADGDDDDDDGDDDDDDERDEEDCEVVDGSDDSDDRTMLLMMMPSFPELLGTLHRFFHLLVAIFIAVVAILLRITPNPPAPLAASHPCAPGPLPQP